MAGASGSERRSPGCRGWRSVTSCNWRSCPEPWLTSRLEAAASGAAHLPLIDPAGSPEILGETLVALLNVSFARKEV